MKIVKVSIELVVDNTDPEWFGDFGPENIMEVKDFE
jgi:hypothetical protein